MHATVTVSQSELPEVLLAVAPVRPVFVWGQPGIAKSSIVEQTAADLGLPCVTLMGSQLAAEDLIGVPQVENGFAHFAPLRLIARPEPFCLFVDEFNAASPEVQKACYSLIAERRIGEYVLPPGSIVVGAGNRQQDTALVKPMASAVVNRFFHVHLAVVPREWLAWAEAHELHPLVLDYIRHRPHHLVVPPPKIEQAFSTPRSWHIVSDVLRGFGEPLTERAVALAAHGAVTPEHATQFCAFARLVRDRYSLAAILKGERGWPSRPDERDVLYFLAGSFRDQLLKELPPSDRDLTAAQRDLSHRAKGLLGDLAKHSVEMAQLVVAGEGGGALPPWFLAEIVRVLPQLAERAERKP